MPGSDPHRTSRLRLAFARHRLRAFIRQIDAVEASNFPHSDGKEALAYIRAHSETQMTRLAIDPSSDEGIVDGICEQISIFVQRYTRTLGFILRSTNVRNPFELHYHLKRFLSNIIDPDARLLISSEWEFIPFTYPMNLALLPKFALVGIPASESDNVLVIPLAGHEIGHSAWLYHGFGEAIEAELASNIETQMNRLATETQRFIDSFRLGDFGKEVIRQQCLTYGLLQLEELFCDAIGLGFFGTSYLHAYEYFLAPGGGTRVMDYPSDLDRVKFLEASAAKLSVPFDASVFDRWQDSSENLNANKDLIAILDASVSASFPSALALACDLLASKEIQAPAPSSVDRILHAFRRNEPDADGGSLPEVVSAGWNYVREGAGLAAEEEREEYRTLGDLMLKSVEVSEFLERTGNA